MDNKALNKLSYGLYVVATNLDGKDAGCIVNTVIQVTGDPVRLAVTMNKSGFTCKAIEKSMTFTASVLLKNADKDIIKTFGFSTSETNDKFSAVETGRDAKGNPYVLSGTAARFSCEVEKVIDLGTHMMYIGRATEGEVLSDGEVLTYEQYHKDKKTVKGYKCTVCGYVHEGDSLPEDFICPWCKVGADKFIKI